MKRWSFKRASEGKPCIKSCTPPLSTISGSGSASLSPTSVSEDSFFSSTNPDKDSSSEESDYDSPWCPADHSLLEDLLSLNSFRDSEFYRDLEGGALPQLSPFSGSACSQTDRQLLLPSCPHSPERESPPVSVVTQFSPRSFQSCSFMDTIEDPVVMVSTTLYLHGPETPETPETQGRPERPEKEEEEALSNPDRFPFLMRSMATSHKLSLGVPIPLVDLGQRLSLEAAMDSDEERLEQAFVFPACSGTCLKEQPVVPCLRNDAEMVCGRMLNSRSEILATEERSHAARVSYVVETSKQAARAAGEEIDPEENLHSAEGQSHMVMVQRVLRELKQFHGAKHRNTRSENKDTGNVTWYEFLSNDDPPAVSSGQHEEEDEGLQRRGTKVKRTLSSLRSRVTGSFNKDKGKNQDKEQQREKEREREREREREHKQKGSVRSSSGHHLVSSCASCSLCSETLQKKHGLQCMNCVVNVHKSCRTLLAESSNNRFKKDCLHKASSSASTNAALRDRHQQPPPSLTAPAQDPDGWQYAPGMTLTPPASSAHSDGLATYSSDAQSSLGFNFRPRYTHSSGSLPGEMDETDAFRLKRSEDAISLAPSTTDANIVEDAYFSGVRADLETDAQDLCEESWSQAVDQTFVKKQTKETVKRQDVIYELMQTEMHHVRTLKIMQCVYVRELRDSLQMEERQLDCLFPRLENLLELHTQFLSRLRERRQNSLEPGSDKNYCIQRLADVLVSQFSGEVGVRMKESYGDFCSHHTEAVSYYKEQLQNNKKFQNLVRKINNLSIVRRLGVTECILLVTQRITKYPVLVERILHNTEVGTEEHEELVQALAMIKGVISQVDALVSLHENDMRLRNIANKMEPKSQGKIKDGRVFRREDLLAQGRRKLLHEGTVTWKAASGRFKDMVAVLLSDVLLLLQDKDQRYIFSTVDNKPSVISLQKLIVREVAHEEKAMFLICASSNEPEMYEIHTASKEERNAWMTHIRQAVESCPPSEERLFSEEEEARAARFKDFQERLNQKDLQIAQGLRDKLQLFADMAEYVSFLEDSGSRSRLLLRGDMSDLHQGEQLLQGAIHEVESLQKLLLSGRREAARQAAVWPCEGLGSGALPRRADTFGGYDSTPTILSKNGSMRKNSSGEVLCREQSQRASSDPQLTNTDQEKKVDELSCSAPVWSHIWYSSFPEAEFFDRVRMLSQKLYSLQAIICQQDSHIELQRASLTERASFPGRHHGNMLLEQEKARALALQKEELASFHKLQVQQRQEQARWQREKERHRLQADTAETRLRQREDECRRMEECLAEERQELERQRETYQQDLERLRESTRAVEREKDKLEHQRKIKRKTIEVVPLSGSLNGDLLLGLGANPGGGVLASDLPLPQKSHIQRSSQSVSPADYPEVLRRETTPLAVKTEVPLHLVSTTNQQHKQLGVQQQIPTKLALIRGKDKPSKGKTSHRADSTASVDMKQILPLKLSSRDDIPHLRTRRSLSPSQQLPLDNSFHTDLVSPPESGPDLQTPDSCQPASLLKPPLQLTPQTPSLSTSLPSSSNLTEDLGKEDIIFF